MSIENDLATAGIALDVAESEATGGPEGLTISMRCARAQAAGKRWGCIACRALDVLVARGHCTATLAGQPVSALAMARALIWLLAPVAVLTWLVLRLL